LESERFVDIQFSKFKTVLIANKEWDIFQQALSLEDSYTEQKTISDQSAKYQDQ